MPLNNSEPVLLTEAFHPERFLADLRAAALQDEQSQPSASDRSQVWARLTAPKTDFDLPRTLERDRHYLQVIATALRRFPAAKIQITAIVNRLLEARYPFTNGLDASLSSSERRLDFYHALVLVQAGQSEEVQSDEVPQISTAVATAAHHIAANGSLQVGE